MDAAVVIQGLEQEYEDISKEIQEYLLSSMEQCKDCLPNNFLNITPSYSMEEPAEGCGETKIKYRLFWILPYSKSSHQQLVAEKVLPDINCWFSEIMEGCGQKGQMLKTVLQNFLIENSDNESIYILEANKSDCSAPILKLYRV